MCGKHVGCPAPRSLKIRWISAEVGVWRPLCDYGTGANGSTIRIMSIPSNRLSEPELSSSGERGSSSSVALSSPAAGRDVEAERPSRYVLPQDLDAAIRRLSDPDLERLATAVLDERSRRRGPQARQESHGKRPDEASSPSLPLGKVNAVRAAFQAGVTPKRIAREIGLSRSEVKSALDGFARTR